MSSFTALIVATLAVLATQSSTVAGLNLGPAPVDLASAGSFAILTKTGITNVYQSAVNGDIGASPITGAAIHLTCGELTGVAYSVDAAGPGAPCMTTDATKLTAAIGDMETAYTNAAGRVLPDESELGAGDISGQTIYPGLYKWGSSLSINTEVFLSGDATDVWIFQVAGSVIQAANIRITLLGGALAKNIFWQVAGTVEIGVGAHFEGVALCSTAINMKTGATMNGRLLAQTAVTLQMNTVTQPAL